MQPGQTLASLTAKILAAVESVLERERPDIAVVQGDTTTTMAGALGAFYHRIAVAHVEAGLRTGDLGHPFPEAEDKTPSISRPHTPSKNITPSRRHESRTEPAKLWA